MKKYYLIISNSLNESFAYRLSFFLWRVRSFVQYTVAFFFWLAIVPVNTSVLGYSQTAIITYMFGGMLLQSLIFSTRSQEIGNEINQGTLSQYLLQPISYISLWFARDLGDKLLNLLFSLVELALIIFLFHPPLFINVHIITLFVFFLTVGMAVVLYFFCSVILGLFGFWNSETWGMRFLFAQLLSFFSGGIFPLDMLPHHIFSILQFFPFPYLFFFPLKVYLGTMSTREIIIGLLVMLFWIEVLYLFAYSIWHKGLKVYTAQGA